MEYTIYRQSNTQQNIIICTHLSTLISLKSQYSLYYHSGKKKSSGIPNALPISYSLKASKILVWTCFFNLIFCYSPFAKYVLSQWFSKCYWKTSCIIFTSSLVYMIVNYTDIFLVTSPDHHHHHHDQNNNYIWKASFMKNFFVPSICNWQWSWEILKTPILIVST